MKSPNKHLGILKIFLILFFAFPLIFSGIKFETAHAELPECEQLQDPTKTSGWIITVIEESILTPTSTSGPQTGTNIINCFRQNVLNADKTSYNSKYVTACTPIPPDVICQKVQVYLAQSGADLLYTYIGQIYKWAAATIGIVAVLYLVWGGIEISTAQGDSGKIEKAKERITQSLAGLVLLFLSALILYTINPNFFTIS